MKKKTAKKPIKKQKEIVDRAAEQLADIFLQQIYEEYSKKPTKQ